MTSIKYQLTPIAFLKNNYAKEISYTFSIPYYLQDEIFPKIPVDITFLNFDNPTEAQKYFNKIGFSDEYFNTNNFIIHAQQCNLFLLIKCEVQDDLIIKAGNYYNSQAYSFTIEVLNLLTNLDFQIYNSYFIESNHPHIKNGTTIIKSNHYDWPYINGEISKQNFEKFKDIFNCIIEWNRYLKSNTSIFSEKILLSYDYFNWNRLIPNLRRRLFDLVVCFEILFKFKITEKWSNTVDNYCKCMFDNKTKNGEVFKDFATDKKGIYYYRNQIAHGDIDIKDVDIVKQIIKLRRYLSNIFCQIFKDINCYEKKLNYK